MLRTITLGLLLLLPSVLSAQEGSIAYTHSVEIDFEIPEEIRARMEAAGMNRAGGGLGMFPTERTSDVLLIFNEAESLMKPVPPPPDQPGHPGGGRDDFAARHAGMAARMRMASSSRSDRETIVEAHVDFGAGSIVEAREFLGRTFIIEDERPAFEWRITSEQAEFLGYMVMKATAQQDSTAIEAWFTPQIPVQGGPGPYGGLPGMILVVSVNDGHTQYSATEVSMMPVAEGVIVRPTEGEVVTREEYEEVVAEKLEELRTEARGRIRP